MASLMVCNFASLSHLVVESLLSSKSFLMHFTITVFSSCEHFRMVYRTINVIDTVSMLCTTAKELHPMFERNVDLFCSKAAQRFVCYLELLLFSLYLSVHAENYHRG